MRFGSDLTKELRELLQQPHVFAVTDDRVHQLYGELFLDARTKVFLHGEAQKTLDTVRDICTFLLENGADRHAVLVAVGGGVVGDITGFCAAIYMRGIAWVNVPTTLLAQCDSAIGGKTGVDLDSYKNILGAFHLPNEIYISSHFLKTLPAREMLCGMGELLKTACLDQDLFAFYQKNRTAIERGDAAILQDCVQKCAAFKDAVVTKDPHERTGLRKILNYGHTVGHALEKSDGLKRSHGEYVLHGMRVENRMCRKLLDPAYFAVCDQLIGALLASTPPLHLDLHAAARAASADKKNCGGKISVVAVTKAGKTEEVFFTQDEFTQAFTAAFGECFLDN